MKNKLVSNEPDSKRSAKHQKAFELLEQIENLKTRLERKLEAAATLKATGAPIPADQLLEAMFHKVCSAMYLAKWSALKPVKWRGKSNLPENIATYQATM